MYLRIKIDLVVRRLLGRIRAWQDNRRVRAVVKRLIAQESGRKKKHHYVPQTYLRRFTSGDDAIWVFDKRTQKTFKTNILNVAQESSFYDLHFDTSTKKEAQEFNDAQLGEEALAQIDGGFSACLDALNAIPVGGRIPDHLRRDAIFFLTIQHLRTKEARESAVAMYVAVHNESAKALAGHLYPELMTGELRVGTSPEYHSAIHLAYLFNRGVWEGIAAAMEPHYCVLVDFGAPGSVFTSDHPVAIQPHKVHPYPMGIGLGSEGVEVMMPVSDRRVLVFYERSYHRECQPLHLSCVGTPAAQARTCNLIQLGNAHRWLFSAEDNFDDLRTWIAEHPELGQERRWRVQVSSGGQQCNY